MHLDAALVLVKQVRLEVRLTPRAMFMRLKLKGKWQNHLHDLEPSDEIEDLVEKATVRRQLVST